MKKDLEPWELEDTGLVELLTVDSPDSEQTAEDVEEGSKLVWDKIGLLDRSRELMVLAEGFMAPACSVIRQFCDVLTPGEEYEEENPQPDEENNP